MATAVGDLIVYLRANTLAFDKGMASASARLTKLGKQMTATGRMMMMRMSLPLAAIGGAAIKMSMDFETSMQHIVGLVGVAQEQVNAWKEDVKALAPELGKTSTELANAMFFITSAGLRGEQALSALTASAKGAAAGLGETAVVADAATSAMNAYGAANLSAEMATSILVATVREGKAEASEIAPVIGQIIPVAAELGVEFHEVGAALSVMTRLGLNAAISATALRSTLATILKPTKQAKDEMAKYGMTMSELKTILREQGLIALLTKLKETFGDNEESMQKVFRNVRALNGVLSIVGKSAENNVKIFNSLAKTTTDDLDKAFSTAAGTARFKLNAALADMQNTFITLGDLLVPTVIPAIQKLGKAFAAVTSFLDVLNPAQRLLVVNVGLVAVAAGPLIWAFGKMAIAAGAATGAIAKWNATATTTAVVAEGAALSVNQMAAALGMTITPAAGATTAMGTMTGTIAGMKAALFATVGGVTALGVAVGALAFLIGVAIGDQIRPFVNELLGLNEALDLIAHKNRDITDAMVEHNDVFDNAVHTLNQLKKSLHLTGKEWDFNNEKTRVNAERIQMLTDKAIALAKKQKEASTETKKTLTIHERALDIRKRAGEQVEAQMERANKAHEQNIALLKEELGLYTKEDIVANLEEMTEQYEEMKKLGIDKNQLADVFGDKMLEWLKLAKENNVELPRGTREMGKDLEGKVNPAIKKMIDNWRVLRNNINAAGKVIDGITMGTGEKVGAALGGGFKSGVEEGIKHGQVAIDAWVKRIEDTTIYIRPQLDLEGWNEAVQDAIAGRIPDTTG
jgi:TP901 family phage tail tape measure protein